MLKGIRISLFIVFPVRQVLISPTQPRAVKAPQLLDCCNSNNNNNNNNNNKKNKNKNKNKNDDRNRFIIAMSTFSKHRGAARKNLRFLERCADAGSRCGGSVTTLKNPSDDHCVPQCTSL
jgi:hypothetical protein